MAVQWREAAVPDKTTDFDIELVPEDGVAGENTEPIKHLVVFTKAQDTLAALRRVKERLGRDSTVLVVQNGWVTPSPPSHPFLVALKIHWASVVRVVSSMLDLGSFFSFLGGGSA
jgi:hypothetical protein